MPEKTTACRRLSTDAEAEVFTIAPCWPGCSLHCQCQTCSPWEALPETRVSDGIALTRTRYHHPPRGGQSWTLGNKKISDKKKAKRAFAEAVKEMEEIRHERNVVFHRMRMMKKEANDLAGNNCIKDENGKIVFAENGRKRVWKEQMEAITNEENPWEWTVNVEVVEGSIESFAMDEVEKALGIMENGKASGPTGVVKEHLGASPHGKQVILQIANEILDGKDMPHDWKTSTVPIYKKKGSVMDCVSYISGMV